jgi:hypothetical protein
VIVKLKTADFRLRARSQRLAARPGAPPRCLLRQRRCSPFKRIEPRRSRLIGIGAGMLVGAAAADLPTLFERAGEEAIGDRMPMRPEDGVSPASLLAAPFATTPGRWARPWP